MTLVVRFMNQMDADGMNVTARSYATQIANFSYCIGAALAQANAILTGWHIGAKEYESFSPSILFWSLEESPIWYMVRH